jgi:hypothetical protein
MAVQTFDELYTHAGHDIQISQYYNINAVVVNVAIECMECYEVLLDFDKE